MRWLALVLLLMAGICLAEYPIWVPLGVAVEDEAGVVHYQNVDTNGAIYMTTNIPDTASAYVSRDGATYTAPNGMDVWIRLDTNGVPYAVPFQVGGLYLGKGGCGWVDTNGVWWHRCMDDTGTMQTEVLE